MKKSKKNIYNSLDLLGSTVLSVALLSNIFVVALLVGIYLRIPNIGVVIVITLFLVPKIPVLIYATGNSLKNRWARFYSGLVIVGSAIYEIISTDNPLNSEELLHPGPRLPAPNAVIECLKRMKNIDQANPAHTHSAITSTECPLSAARVTIQITKTVQGQGFTSTTDEKQTGNAANCGFTCYKNNPACQAKSVQIHGLFTTVHQSTFVQNQKKIQIQGNRLEKLNEKTGKFGPKIPKPGEGQGYVQYDRPVDITNQEAQNFAVDPKPTAFYQQNQDEITVQQKKADHLLQLITGKQAHPHTIVNQTTSTNAAIKPVTQPLAANGTPTNSSAAATTPISTSTPTQTIPTNDIT
jgi:hypothetical protein